MKIAGRKMTIEEQKKVEGTLFILPWVMGFLLFMAYPLLYSIVLSFNQVKISGVRILTEFIGLQNYKYALFTEPNFQDAMIGNLKEMILIIPIIVVFAFLIANLLNQDFSSRGFFRMLFFLPVIFTTGFMIRELLEQNMGDMSMSFATNTDEIKLYLRQYLTESWANPIISIIDKFVFILWYSGVQILIFLAGLQSIGKQIYDAAKIDGASAWESFWKITLPGSIPFFFLNTIYTITNLFTLDWNPIISYIQDNMYRPDRGLGYAAALGWIYFIMISILLGPIFLLFNKRRGKTWENRKKIGV